MRFFVKFLIYITFVFVFLLRADEYELGHGLKLSDELHIGGYFSLDYSISNEKRQFRLDDVAVLVYGDLSSKLSYLIELEAAPFYVKNYTTDTSTKDTTFHYERMYVNYTHSEMFNIRIGKQITPIGYWNLEPINVLRDTSSNPLYSNKMFPKLLTGVDLHGYLDNDNSLKYHLFMQNNDDLDEDYINIKNDYFIGASLEYEILDELSFGGAVGNYKTIDDDSDVVLYQLDAKYDNYPFVVQAEMAYNDIDNKLTGITNHQFAAYSQATYNLDMKNAIIGRYEYFEENHIDDASHIGVIGYSYRPMYSVSFKAEYQFNSDSDLSKSLISFSVLF